MIENATLVADTVGVANDVHRDVDLDRLVGHHGVEIEVDHVAAANRVALDLAHHGLYRRAAVDGDVNQHGLATDLVEQAADRRSLDVERLRIAAVAVDDGPD